MKCTPEVFAKLGKLHTRFAWAVVNLAGVAVNVFNYRTEAKQFARTDRNNLTVVDATGVLWEEPVAYTIEITDRFGETTTETRSNATAARRLCREEVKWENTARVVCKDIDFDEPGDYAQYHSIK